MSRPYSAALLATVRKAMKRRGLNVAALAKELDLPRRELRPILRGAAPLPVDLFFAMVESLQLTPQELGVPSGLAQVVEEEEQEDAAQQRLEPALALHSDADDDAGPQEVALADPDGPQAAEIMRLGFALGVDMHLVLRTAALQGSGVPESTLARFPEHLPISLDAAYHHHYRARYHADALELRLGFDRIRTCLFPWAAIERITLVPEPPDEAPQEPAPQPEEPGRPGLRLVKT